jgi:hypothetical protein
MTPGSGGCRRQVRRSGAHRKTRERRPILTRTLAAAAAVVCLGAAYEATAPTVHALAIVFRTPDGNGNTNEVRINILQGNIFDPQLNILGNNVSDNSTSIGGAASIGKNPLVDNLLFNNPITQFIERFWNQTIVFGSAATGPINNTTQISFGSFNIFNPQASIFGSNLSNNTTMGNIAIGHGNQTSSAATSPLAGFWTGLFGGLTGNGNSLQLAFFSDNIFNPQGSLFGSNTSNNTATTNVADNNGNYSQTTASGGLLGAVVHLWGSFLLGGMTGNGNTNQTAVGSSNISNPQGSIGGNNQSSNTAVTNEAVGNGNSSTTTVGPGIGSGNTVVIGTTGNGNTTQTAAGAGNIENTQVSVGSVGKTTVTTATASQTPAPTVGTNATNVASSTSVTSTTGSTTTSGSTTSPNASTTSPNASTSTPQTGTSSSSTIQTVAHPAVSGATTGSGSSTGAGSPTGSGSSTGSSGGTGGSSGSGGSAK